MATVEASVFMDEAVIEVMATGGSKTIDTGSMASTAVGLCCCFLLHRLPLTLRDLTVAFERREHREPRVQYSVSL